MTSTDLLDQPGGDRLRWHLRSAETGGRLVRAELWLPPGGPATSEAHGGEERFEVLAGRLGVALEGRLSALDAGARLSIPGGVPRRWWNAGDGELHLMVEVAPPGGFEAAVARKFETTSEGERR